MNEFEKNNHLTRVRVEVLIQKGDQVLFLATKNMTPSGPAYYYLPGGTLEKGETIETCAIREICEELGLSIQLKDVVLVVDEILPSEHSVHIVLSASLAKNKHFESEGEANWRAYWFKIGDLPTCTKPRELASLLQRYFSVEKCPVYPLQQSRTSNC